jgi:uncharacterized protein (DUF58 family)
MSTMSSVKLISSLFVRFWRTIKQGVQTANHATNLPVLSAQEIVDYGEELSRIAAKVSANLKQSDALRQGEQASRFMGAGLEYEESRPYQLGDEIRRINWRLMAKTGQAFTKLFQEERQENWFILVDHRASMRFGTRTHLKATQAVRVAGFYAWLAQQAGLPVSTGRLAESFISSPIYEGNQSYAQVMQAISKPCPPLANDSHVEPHLNDVLLSLTARLQPGTRLIVISDFHDVDKRTTEILTALQDKIKIKAVWVKDMSETQLPDIEGLQLQSMVNNRVYEIANASQRERYQAWSDQYQFQIQSVLQHANVTLYSVFAHESLLQLSESLNSPNQAIDIVQTDANKTAPKRAQYA